VRLIYYGDIILSQKRIIKRGICGFMFRNESYGSGSRLISIVVYFSVPTFLMSY
jgi:hypothetical protein